jgi:hypothetical protein
MRILSLNFRKALFSQESGEVPIFLLTITHPSLTSPIHLSTDATTLYSTTPLAYQTVSRGISFLYAGIDVTIPDEQDKTPPASKLTIQNVTESLIPLARSVSTPPLVKIEAVLASSPDAVEMTIGAMNMSNLIYDANQLVFDLTIDALTTEPFPSGGFNPSSFPGLFF